MLLMRQSSNANSTILKEAQSPDNSLMKNNEDDMDDLSSNHMSRLLNQNEDVEEVRPQYFSPDQSDLQLELSLSGDEEREAEIKLDKSTFIQAVDEDAPKTTLATKAVDELYTLIVSFCNVVEVFFQPYFPMEVTYDLHNDFLLLVQHLMFRAQESGKVYECLTVLMRVDSQVDDKDLREKMRLCRGYSPVDFGIEQDFSMYQPKVEVNLNENLLTERLSINNSGVPSAEREIK